jgi:single-stranded-DNA-specific exonuclease
MPIKTYSARKTLSEEVDESLKAYPELVRTLLFSRGITNSEDAEKFFNPDYVADLHDPYLLADMDMAVQRIFKAIEKKEKILIYSDYDADGIPGGVMLKEFFDKIGYTNVENYIPHRHDEGYGLHLEAVETFAESGVKLLITVDCGIVDTDQVARAQKLGIDVIITDHHEPNEVLPPAFAIINPKRKDCTYPEQILCGSGVVFKLIQGMLFKNRFDVKEGQEKWFLDLVGIATLSDMVPLTGENRALAHYGLKVIRKSPRPGMQKLWAKLRVNPNNVTEDDIGFSFSPRLNAASRMGHPMDGFKLLYTKDVVEADEVTTYLSKINDERKGTVAAIVKDIKKHLREKKEELPNVLVFGNPDWKPGILGLVANSIMDDVRKPIFVWGRNGDKDIKGSCRSDGSVSLVALMEATKDTFLQYGGHKLAGGFAISHENIHTLEGKLNEAYKSVEQEKEDETVMLDRSLSLEDVTWDNYRIIEKFAPFGVGNSKPIFIFENIIVSDTKQFGKELNHMEIVFEQKTSRPIKAIKFFSRPENFTNVPEKGKPVSLIASFEKSTFGRYPELRLRIIDII